MANGIFRDDEGILGHKAESLDAILEMLRFDTIEALSELGS